MVRKRKEYKPYYVSYKVNTRLGKTNGRKEFKTWDSAQSFAVRVDRTSNADLISWGRNQRN